MSVPSAGKVIPVLQVGEVKSSAAGPDVAVLIHVHLVVWGDEAVGPDVELTPINQQGLLNVLLDHPLRASPVAMIARMIITAQM